MRENRPYGSEGGATAKAAVPTPIMLSPLRGWKNATLELVSKGLSAPCRLLPED